MAESLMTEQILPVRFYGGGTREAVWQG